MTPESWVKVFLAWTGVAILLVIGISGCSETNGTQRVNEEISHDLPMIDSLWDYTDPEASEARFRQLLPEARRSSKYEYIVELMTQIARAQGLNERFAQAHETLQEAEDLLSSGMTKGRVRILLERGRLLNSSGNPVAAAPLFEDAFDLAEASRLEFYAVDAAHMLGIVRPGEESITWNQRGIEMALQASDPLAQQWLGPLYNNLAWTYHDLNRYGDALRLFEQDFELRRALYRPIEANVARWSIANALRHLGRIEEALAIQQELLGAPERQNNEAEGYTREEIGECLLALGKAEEAKVHFARAWALLREDPWLSREEPQRLARLHELGGID